MTTGPSAWHYLTEEAWQRRLTVALTACVAVVYLAGSLWTLPSRGSLVKGDARSYFAYLPSIVLDRDLDLRNQFAELQPEGNNVYPFGEGRDGVAANPFPIVPALLWLPGYVLGLGVDAALVGRGGQSAPLGYGRGALLGAALWSIVLAGMGAELTRRLIRDWVSPESALIATLLGWLATPAIYYTAISPLYSHATAWFVVSLMLWLTWRASQRAESLTAWLWAGVAAGLVVGVRLQDGPLLSVAVALLVASCWPRPVTGLRALTAWAGGAAVGLSPQVFTWLRLQGATVPFGGVSALRVPEIADAAGVLFSIGYRGWISWTPIVAPALAGVVLLTRRATGVPRWFAWSALLGVVGMFLLDVMHPFGAGAAFGGRRYVSATPLVAIGLAAWLRPDAATGARRLWAPALFAVLLMWNGWLLTSYEILALRHNLRPTLVETVRYGVGLRIPR